MNIRVIALIAPACIGLFLTPFSASASYTGNELLEFEEKGDAYSVMMYIKGVLDGAMLAPGVSFCIPSGVTNGQVRDVVMKFLRDNPAITHISAPISIESSISTAFPCK